MNAPDKREPDQAPAKPQAPRSAETGADDTSALKKPELSAADFELLYAAVNQMAHFLSDVNLFKDAVSKKPSDKAQNWEDIPEILPEPLLKQVGDQWHWRCDINANPLQIPELASAVETGAVMQPKAQESNQVAITESKIKFVENADEAIRFYTEQRVDLEKLGSDLRLLEISPTFSSFTSAASSYRASAGPGPTEISYPSLSKDRSLIEEYWVKFSASLRSLKYLLFLAEWIGLEKSGGPSAPPLGSRIRTEMVELIARDLDFIRLKIPDIEKLLARFKDDFSAFDQPAKAAFEKIAHDDSPVNVDWVQRLQTELQNIDKARAEASVPPPPRPDPIDFYFARRARALITYVRDKKPLQPLCLTELIARALFDLPPFHGHPGAIRLLDYAACLVATKQYPSASATAFAVALLAVLGFGKQLEAQASLLAPILGENLAFDLAETAKSNRRAGDRAMLILGGTPEIRVPLGSFTLLQQPKGEGSYAAAWTISQTHAVFPIHFTDLNTLMLPYSGFNHVLENQLEFTVEIRDENLPAAVPINPQVAQATLGGPSMGKPTTLDDAIAITKNLRSAS